MKELQAVKDVSDDSGNGSDTEIVMTDEGVRIRMLNAIVFEPGSANLTIPSMRVLDIVSASIKNFPNDFKVEGHTSESRSAKGSYYPSNWELSTARASTVVRYLLGKGFDPKRFQAVGYADTRPLSLDETNKKHFLNQRVDIVLMSYDGKNSTSSKSILDNQ
jgi:chemotaxis protein MotB